MDSRNYSMSESFKRMFSPCCCHGKPPYLNAALLNLTKVFGPSFYQSMYIPFPLCIHLFGMNVVFQYASPCRYQMTSDRDISSLHSIDLYIWPKLERVILTFPTTTLGFYLLILLYMEREGEPGEGTTHMSYTSRLPWDVDKSTSLIPFTSAFFRASGNSFWRITSGTVLTSCRFRGMNVIFAPGFVLSVLSWTLASSSCDIHILNSCDLSSNGYLRLNKSSWFARSFLETRDARPSLT